MSDHDMINYGLPPQDHWKGQKLYSFEGSTPSLVNGNKAAFEAVIGAIIAVSEDPAHPAISEYRGTRHTADREILKLRPDLISNVNHYAQLTHQRSADNLVTHFSRKDVIAFTGDLTITKPALARSLRPFQFAH